MCRTIFKNAPNQQMTGHPTAIAPRNGTALLRVVAIDLQMTGAQLRAEFPPTVRNIATYRSPYLRPASLIKYPRI